MPLPEALSEEHIREHCPHCDPTADAFRDLLEETDQFRIVCDVHPIVEGHSLIIPKKHLSCVGEYDDAQLQKFSVLYDRVSAFVRKQYGQRNLYQREGKYLFFSIEDRRWTVDTSLVAPRFFRDRFAAALGRPERGNWKEMHMNEKLMAAGLLENTKMKSLWQKNIRTS